MKKILLLIIISISTINVSQAQFKLKKAISAGAKTVKAVTLTDAQMAEYVREIGRAHV